MNVCPTSRKPGRQVRPPTLLSLVHENRHAEFPGREWFFCSVTDCDVVYFADDGTTIPKSDLKVRVRLKETDAPHTVCYCFGHTVESIREEVARTGKSTAVDSITARVKAGECRCETKNPQGTCCLGDVGRVVSHLVEVAADMECELLNADQGCCNK